MVATAESLHALCNIQAVNDAEFFTFVEFSEFNT
jgi:hypothetical protein